MIGPGDTSRAKQDAAERAVEHVQSGMALGLGSGSTAKFAVEAIGRRLKAGELREVVGVATSVETRELASALAIPLTDLGDCPLLDMTIDGADEIDPDGNLIKGGGGALLWEKMVATASKRLCIVADESKLVDRLGEAFPLPVEVVRFGWQVHRAMLRELGAEPVLRSDLGGAPCRTDEGHYILDCKFENGIEDPYSLQQALVIRPGIVETGLFLDMKPEVIVGRA
ncbi:MAG: ribose 5-phosphate isomerase A [Gemmatimonadales bacterium]|jgi:ribose 5-phosphate isomerase A